MEIKFNIGSKKFLLKPYTTKKEKDVLLMASFNNYEIDQILKIFDLKTDYELSNKEKKILLYKFREISLGDEININLHCDKCKSTIDTVITTENLIVESTRNDNDIKKLNLDVNDKTLQEFVDINVDELEINEYEELMEKVKANQISFNFLKESKCLKCGNINFVDLGETRFLIESLSDDTLMTLYKTYHFLNHFGNYSFLDVDSMLPFERTVMVGLVEQTKEDLNN